LSIEHQITRCFRAGPGSLKICDPSASSDVYVHIRKDRVRIHVKHNATIDINAEWPFAFHLGLKHKKIRLFIVPRI
jgi:hypothetical protein